MSNHIEKGNALEGAVQAIENAILKNSPSMAKQAFTIESKKIVIVDGVKHEVDVWVEIANGKGYESLYIFECKNWKDVVGKNEIIIFSEKIDAVQAQRGFFVAKSFSRYAKAQAKKDKSIVLLTATEHPIEKAPLPIKLHYLIRHVTSRNITFEQMKTPSEIVKLNMNEAECVLEGNIIDFPQFADSWINESVEKYFGAYPSNKFTEGTYENEIMDAKNFDPDCMKVNGKDIKRISLVIKVTSEVVHPKIISHYEVEARGRVYSLTPLVRQDGEQANISLIIGAESA